MKNIYTVQEILKLLKICRSTMYAWERKGILDPKRNGKTNHRFFDKDDIDKLAHKIQEKREQDLIFMSEIITNRK